MSKISFIRWLIWALIYQYYTHLPDNTEDFKEKVFASQCKSIRQLGKIEGVEFDDEDWQEIINEVITEAERD